MMYHTSCTKATLKSSSQTNLRLTMEGITTGASGNTAHCMIPVDYRVHLLVYLYTIINTTLHSHESGPKPPIFWPLIDLLYFIPCLCVPHLYHYTMGTQHMVLNSLHTRDHVIFPLSVSGEKLLYVSGVTRVVQDNVAVMHWLQYSWYEKFP